MKRVLPRSAIYERGLKTINEDNTDHVDIDQNDK